MYISSKHLALNRFLTHDACWWRLVSILPALRCRLPEWNGLRESLWRPDMQGSFGTRDLLGWWACPQFSRSWYQAPEDFLHNIDQVHSPCLGRLLLVAITMHSVTENLKTVHWELDCFILPLDILHIRKQTMLRSTVVDAFYNKTLVFALISHLQPSQAGLCLRRTTLCHWSWATHDYFVESGAVYEVYRVFVFSFSTTED